MDCPIRPMIEPAMLLEINNLMATIVGEVVDVVVGVVSVVVSVAVAVAVVQFVWVLVA